MTRFERAAQGPMEMSITIAFCIAGFLEQSGIQSFTNDSLLEWMCDRGKEIEEWLNEEAET